MFRKCQQRHCRKKLDTSIQQHIAARHEHGSIFKTPLQVCVWGGEGSQQVFTKNSTLLLQKSHWLVEPDIERQNSSKISKFPSTCANRKWMSDRLTVRRPAGQSISRPSDLKAHCIASAVPKASTGGDRGIFHFHLNCLQHLKGLLMSSQKKERISGSRSESQVHEYHK